MSENARPYPPPNVECLNGLHSRCDGIATRLPWNKGQEPAPECSCLCHYPVAKGSDESS